MRNLYHPDWLLMVVKDSHGAFVFGNAQQFVSAFFWRVISQTLQILRAGMLVMKYAEKLPVGRTMTK
jgi:hypothetical protein